MFERFENLRLDRKVVVLDLETTGADYKTDRIMQFALLSIEPGDIPQVFAAHVDPGVPVPATATTVHGIRDADVEHTPPFSRHAEEIKDSLNDATLIGYGIKKLHLPMLIKEFGRLGIEFSLKRRLVIDVAQFLGAAEPPTLSDALELICGRKHEKPDRAEEDVDAIALLLDGILAGNPALPRTITELHDRFDTPDLLGLFRYGDDGLIFDFGEHRGRPLSEVAQTDPAYLRGMLESGEFLEDVQEIVKYSLGLAFCE